MYFCQIINLNFKAKPIKNDYADCVCDVIVQLVTQRFCLWRHTCSLGHYCLHRDLVAIATAVAAATVFAAIFRVLSFQLCLNIGPKNAK